MSSATSGRWPVALALVVAAMAAVVVGDAMAGSAHAAIGGAAGRLAHALVVLAARVAAGYALGLALAAGRRLPRATATALLVPSAVVALWPLLGAVLPGAVRATLPGLLLGVPAQLPPFAAIVVGLVIAHRR